MTESVQEAYEKNRKALFVYFYSLTGDRHAAEDLLQEVFLIVLDKATRFDSTRGSFYLWARTVGRNLYFGQVRKFGRGRITAGTDVDGVPAPFSDPAGMVVEAQERVQTLRYLEECLDALPEEDQSVVRRKFLNRSTLMEIGRSLGITKRSVSRRYAGALRALRDCLDVRGVRL